MGHVADILSQSGFLIQVLLLLVAGFASGLINVTAGGGSMLALPVLIFAGLDPVTANATNRVSIVAMGATSAYAFRRQKLSEFHLSARLAACAVPGAIIGAGLASQVDNSMLQRIISVVLIVCVVTLFIPVKPAAAKQVSGMRAWLVYPVMFAIGFYGGFIQVGASFVFMIGLQRLLRIDLVKANMHKVLIVFIYTLPALALFVWMGQVNWVLGIVLAIGTAVGAWLGTGIAISGGERWIRIIVAIVVVLMAGKLFWGAVP